MSTAFLCLQFRFVLYCRKPTDAKAAGRTLMELSPGVNFTNLLAQSVNAPVAIPPRYSVSPTKIHPTFHCIFSNKLILIWPTCLINTALKLSILSYLAFSFFYLVIVAQVFPLQRLNVNRIRRHFFTALMPHISLTRKTYSVQKSLQSFQRKKWFFFVF